MLLAINPFVPCITGCAAGRPDRRGRLSHRPAAEARQRLRPDLGPRGALPRGFLGLNARLVWCVQAFEALHSSRAIALLACSTGAAAVYIRLNICRAQLLHAVEHQPALHVALQQQRHAFKSF